MDWEETYSDIFQIHFSIKYDMSIYTERPAHLTFTGNGIINISIAEDYNLKYKSIEKWLDEFLYSYDYDDSQIEFSKDDINNAQKELDKYYL